MNKVEDMADVRGSQLTLVRNRHAELYGSVRDIVLTTQAIGGILCIPSHGS